jgi:hypothetical protein
VKGVAGMGRGGCGKTASDQNGRCLLISWSF